MENINWDNIEFRVKGKVVKCKSFVYFYDLVKNNKEGLSLFINNMGSEESIIVNCKI